MLKSLTKTKMEKDSNIKIIAFVGLPGSGKSAATEYLRSKGVPGVYFGGVIYRAMADAGVTITADSQERFRREIREKEGKDFVVNRALKQVADLIAAGQKRIVLDGVYSWTEYKIVKKAYPGEVTLVAMVPPKKERHKRLMARKDRPFTQDEANKRDWSEIEVLEKGGPIAIADYFIVNDGSEEDTHRKIDVVLERVGFLK